MLCCAVSLGVSSADSAKDPLPLPLPLPEQEELKVLRIDIWSRRRTPPHVQLGQVTVTLSMLRSVTPCSPSPEPT